MSLFKEIIEELEQAVNEIEEQPEEDIFAFVSEYSDVDIDLDSFKTMLEDTKDATEEVSVKEIEEKAVEEEAVPQDFFEEEAALKEAPKREVSEEDKNAVTIITKGTTINGNISSDGSLDIMGTVKGDIECLGKLTICGKVTGNCQASEVFVTTDRLEGSIVSKSSIKVGLGTVIIGDITASSAIIAGAVKGEIDVKGSVILESTAIIKGNIKAKSIQMANGAVMDGFCSLSYADLKIDSIYE